MRKRNKFNPDYSFTFDAASWDKDIVTVSTMHRIEEFANSDRLPTLPEVAIRMLEIAQQDTPDFGEIGRVIRSDPVTAGKILKTVNSALFGFRSKIETIEQAIPLLGVTLIRTLVLSFNLASHKTHQADLEPILQQHWRSSLTQAVIAELIAEQIGKSKVDPAACFLAAMMQDIGILAMVSEATSEYIENVLERSSFPDVLSSERAYFGFGHTDVSAAIVAQWGMEGSFADAIIHHHDEFAVPCDDLSKEERLKVVMQAANLGATMLAMPKSSGTALTSTVDQWLGFLQAHFDIDESSAQELISEVMQRVSEYSILFNFKIGETIQAERVVEKAKSLLQEIALQNQLNMMASASKAQKQRDETVYRETLTAVYNRRFLNEKLPERLAKTFANRDWMALFFMDVDKFKTINDTLGHAAGDEAIKHVADWLVHSVRSDDIVIRLGGDEFLVILPVVKETEVENIAERIASRIPPMKLSDGTEVPISLSVGCACYRPSPGDTTDINWLIEQADQSMYIAKRSGGDTACVQAFEGTNQAATSPHCV
ncbi:MAG: GGDEF domain-containing protein [Pirellulaceae bacterium]|nr:GGDEF domain-containing protein [Pirellulaceae bacterium]